jgi:hypothetical protein
MAGNTATELAAIALQSMDDKQWHYKKNYIRKIYNVINRQNVSEDDRAG